MRKYKPAVPKVWLYAVAGLMWSLVGIMLIRLAAEWLSSFDIAAALPFIVPGILLAFIVYRFGFSRIVLKNIDRLDQLPEKPCIFAFQAWKSYLVIVFMVALGITLRHSPVPKKYLSVVYNTIGGALFLSSLHYYSSFIKIWKET
ncbi:MAG: hypothetical protein ACM34K_08140 [Bacillota bacterium]